MHRLSKWASACNYIFPLHFVSTESVDRFQAFFIVITEFCFMDDLASYIGSAMIMGLGHFGHETDDFWNTNACAFSWQRLDEYPVRITQSALRCADDKHIRTIMLLPVFSDRNIAGEVYRSLTFSLLYWLLCFLKS